MEVMFYACLIVAGLQLLFCNIAMYRQSRPIGTAAAVCLFVPILGILLMTQLSSCFLLAILLGCLMLLWKSLRFSSRSFSAMSLLGVCLFFGGCSGMVFQNIQHLREEFPVVSLSERLPVLTPQDIVTASTPPTTFIQELDRHYDKLRDDIWSFAMTRTTALTQLHTAAYNLFINSPKFGVARMPSPYFRLSKGDYEAKSVKQPGTFDPLPLSLSEVDGLAGPSTTIFRPMLAMNITEFVPIASLGYIKDRRQAAGFLPHGQRDYAQPDDYYSDHRHEVFKQYTLRRLDLISLLLHETPVAYVTETLPSMERVKDLQTRPLDAFESVGLLKLRAGEDLYAREYLGHTRLVGALRNAKQCMACHDGAYGDMLGAFSYDLVSAGTK